MSSILTKIASHKLAQIRQRKAGLREEELQIMALATPVAPHPLRESLRRPAGDPIHVIAECKKASPSRGLLVPDYDPVALAGHYERAGA